MIAINFKGCWESDLLFRKKATEREEKKRERANNNLNMNMINVYTSVNSLTIIIIIETPISAMPESREVKGFNSKLGFISFQFRNSWHF